jgi:succinate dehydrogenase hydrophobic anchor subunit
MSGSLGFTPAPSPIYDAFDCTTLFFYAALPLTPASFALFIALGLALPALVLSHIVEGVDNIIRDYVHHQNTQTLCLCMLQIAAIGTVKYTYVLLFL